MGFDWPSIHGVMAKVEEELAEVKEAILENKPEHIEEEVGDLCFPSSTSRAFKTGHRERASQDHI